MNRFIASGVMIIALLLGACATGADAGLAEGWKRMVAEDYEGARDAYKAVLQEYPDNAYAHLNLGVAYQQLENYDLARTEYEAAIKYGKGMTGARVVQNGEVQTEAVSVVDKATNNLKSLPE